MKDSSIPATNGLKILPDVVAECSNKDQNGLIFVRANPKP